MSYLVLARKYRPTTFADIVGQEHVVRTLSNAIELGRVHHAFLFTGARGVGKTTTARVLARALNCEKGPTPTPCGTCSACLEILNGASPDVLEIDGASNTGVDNVRELRETVRYLPQRGRTKLYIIDEVHMLSTAAFNALLKTLEEPPPHVKFIFATTEPHKIPITILSRCQRFDYRKVSGAALAEHLRGVLAKEGITFGQAALTTIVREAQGSVRDALSLLDQVLSFVGQDPSDAAVAEALGVVGRETLFAMADAILARDATRLLQAVAEVDLRGHDLAEVAALLVEHLRDLMVVKVVTDPTDALLERSPGELLALQAQAQRVSRPDLHRYFALMVAAAEDTGKSMQPRVSLEMGLLRLLEVEPTQSLSELVARLDTLSGSGKGGQPVKAAPATETKPAMKSAPGAPPARAPQPTVKRESQPLPAEPGPAATEPNQAWTLLVNRVRALRPALASVLEHGRVIQFGPDGVEIGYARSTFYWEAARDPETKELVTQALQEQFGQPVTLTLTPLAESDVSAPASLADMSAEKKRQRERDVKDTGLTHPTVQSAVAILGGKVTDVVPLVSEEE